MQTLFLTGMGQGGTESEKLFEALEAKVLVVDVNDMPEFFRQERFDGNAMMCKKLKMLPYRVYCPRIYHRQRLEQLSKRRYSLRYSAAGEPESATDCRN